MKPLIKLSTMQFQANFAVRACESRPKGYKWGSSRQYSWRDSKIGQNRARFCVCQVLHSHFETLSPNNLPDDRPHEQMPSACGTALPTYTHLYFSIRVSNPHGSEGVQVMTGIQYYPCLIAARVLLPSVDAQTACNIITSPSERRLIRFYLQ